MTAAHMRVSEVMNGAGTTAPAAKAAGADPHAEAGTNLDPTEGLQEITFDGQSSFSTFTLNQLLLQAFALFFQQQISLF